MSHPVIKRDGRAVPFDRGRVVGALRLALAAGDEEEGPALAETLGDEVERDLQTQGGQGFWTVDQVEDTVEYVLFSRGKRRSALAYASLRLKREYRRAERDELTDVVRQILAETHRENANMGNSPAAKMQQIGAVASRLYYTAKVIPAELLLPHQWGEYHIHDLDYYGKTLNCLQIDLSRLLAEGFNPGYGFVRPPRRMASAAALAASIVQSNQNDMYGGQSFPHFDRSLGEVVRRGGADTPPAAAFQAMESFIFTLNMMHSRAGGNVPFSSVNVGGDVTPEGRLATRALLEAYERGLGRGETALFPNIVFRLKAGVNFHPGDPNHDLFQLALRVAARRMNPTFSFMDAPFNAPYGDDASYMGCRSRVMANRCGPAVAARRGNIAPVTLNLPRMALKTRREKEFFAELDRVLGLAEQQLLHRFRLLAELKVKDLPFLMGQKLYQGSEHLEPEDPVGPAIRHGALAVGFIGLAETLRALTGRDHGEDDGALALGLSIVERIHRATQDFSERHDLNFSAYATPAEGLAGRFTAMDRDDFGEVPGVTDKPYYTNSFHLPVAQGGSAFEKIRREAPFHALCPAGHITVVELPAPPVHNPQALETLLRHLAEQGAGYAGFNFPLDECRSCGHSGVFADGCPNCGGTDIRRIRRITGYLSTADRFNEAKRAELGHRRVNRP